MKRPEFANDEHSLPAKIADDGKVHLPAILMDTLIKYRNSYYKIHYIEDQMRDWDSGQYQMKIQGEQTPDVIKDVVCPEVDPDKKYKHGHIEYDCIRFTLSRVQNPQIDIELRYIVTPELAQQEISR